MLNWVTCYERGRCDNSSHIYDDCHFTGGVVIMTVKHIVWLICMFTYMSLRILVLGLILTYYIHVKPHYLSYAENMAKANNVWGMT